MAPATCPHCQCKLPDAGFDRAKLNQCPACHRPLDLPIVRPTIHPSVAPTSIPPVEPETGGTLRYGLLAAGFVSTVTALIVLCVVIARPSKAGPKAREHKPILADGTNPQSAPVASQATAPPLEDKQEPLRER